MADDALTKDDLRNLAKELDKTGEVDIKPRDQESDASDTATDEVDEVESPDQDEIEKESKKPKDKADEDSEGDSADSSDTIDDEDRKPSKDDRDKERFDRNWKKLEERKKEVEAREKEVQKKEREHAKVPSLDDTTDEEGYSVKDYQYAAKKFRNEGDDELARKADEAARALFNTAFQKAWVANYEELVENYPELSDARKPLTMAANQVLETLPFLKSIPDGCKYAVRIAQGDHSASMISELRGENKKLKKELDRFEKATRLSGSGPSRLLPGEHDVSELSRKDGRKALRALAEAADRGDIE